MSFPRLSVRTTASTAVVGIAATATLTLVPMVSGAAAAPSTPPPVSTSHYLRNLTGNAEHDTAVMYRMGASDARYNPAGRRYLVLHDIGAQVGGGVILSATRRYVGYPALVRAIRAYIDGYRTRQQPNAPLVLAVGTNNDGQVSYATGAAWARRVINPLRAQVNPNSGVRVMGANDIEPGFRAGPAASTAWLRGYLANTDARFVFNGSADGCPTRFGATRCNRGWTTGALHRLAGGLAPGRIKVLPQIYNTAMAWQWRTISAAGAQRLSFWGPLTEWTACAQARSCGSASGTSAWRWLYGTLNSSGRTAQPVLEFVTDLRIN